MNWVSINMTESRKNHDPVFSAKRRFTRNKQADIRGAAYLKHGTNKLSCDPYLAQRVSIFERHFLIPVVPSGISAMAAAHIRL